METGNPQNGMCLVDGKTGKLLWGHDKRTYHIHSSGMASDIDPNEPGTELWSGEENYPEERFLRNAKGKVLDKPAKFPVKDLAPRSVWWTGALQRSLILDSKPVAYPSLEPVVDTPFEGSISLIADLYGDWREEVVTSLNGEIRIYSTVFPAQDRRTMLLHDPNYRATVIEGTMGYRQIPLPSLDLKKTAR
jgi:rhamnogalacturonan endolyase